MIQTTYLLAIIYVRYEENVPTALISLSASYEYSIIRVRLLQGLGEQKRTKYKINGTATYEYGRIASSTVQWPR